MSDRGVDCRPRPRNGSVLLTEAEGKPSIFSQTEAECSVGHRVKSICTFSQTVDFIYVSLQFGKIYGYFFCSLQFEKSSVSLQIGEIYKYFFAKGRFYLM